MVASLFALALLPTRTARAADCPLATSTSEVSAHLDQAETAYGQLDVEAFNRALDIAALVLPCVSDAVSPAFAARYHRDMGLRMFVARDAQRASKAFAAARRIEPDYDFPTTLIPSGHAVLGLYETWDVSKPRTVRVAEPTSGALSFDGADDVRRPADFPSIVQLRNASGTTVWTVFAFPDDALPSYEGKPLPAEAGLGLPARTVAARGLEWSGGATLAAGGVLAVMAYLQATSANGASEAAGDYAAYNDAQADYDGAASRLGLARILLAVGAAAAGAGFAVEAVGGGT